MNRCLKTVALLTALTAIACGSPVQSATGTLIDDEGFQMISIETYRLLED